MTLVDSHCHLDDARFDPDREQAIERAREAGVARMLAIGDEAAVRLADAYPFIDAAAGVHPHEAAKAGPETLEKLRDLLTHPKVLAVGEIGLDYHYNFSPPEIQRDLFHRQLEIAARAAKPVIIHTREAWEDTLAILREAWSGPCVLHCFTGSPGQARQALDLGYYLSFAGVVTFPKAAELREAAALVPADRLLIETDAPYLAPVPHRGKRNEPAFILETLRALAALRQTDPAALAAQTTANFDRLFAAP